MVEDGGIDLAEVDGHFEVTLVEIGERRMIADEAVTDGGAGEEDGAGGAVVGAGGAVFFDAAAEFAEGEDDDAVVEAGGFQIVQECFESAGEFAEKLRVWIKLGGVSVVAGLGDVEDARLAAELEQLGDQQQLLGELRVGIVAAEACLPSIGFAEMAGGVEGLGDGSLDEGGDVGVSRSLALVGRRLLRQPGPTLRGVQLQIGFVLEG